MSKHTPGPWTIENANKYGEIRITATAIKRLTYMIALASPDCPDSQTQEANAHLIAAAPDLLPACEAADALFALGVGAVSTTEYTRANSDRCVNEARAVMAQLRAAIAKAKGGAE